MLVLVVVSNDDLEEDIEPTKKISIKEEDHGNGGSFIMGQVWNPIYIAWKWSKGPGHPNMCSIIILLLSGIANTKIIFSACVEPMDKASRCASSIPTRC